MPPRSLVLLFVCVGTAARADDDPLRYLPSDTKVVLSIHFPALDARDRAGGQRLFDELFRTHLAPELGDDAKLPIRDVRRVVLGLPYAGSIHGVCVVEGKLVRKQLDAQMARTAKASGELSVERMGRPAVQVYSRRVNEKAVLAMVPPLAKVPPTFRKLVAPQEAHMAAMDHQTLFVSLSGTKQVERAVRARSSSGLRVAPELAAVLRKQNPDDVASLVLLEDSLHPGLALVADEPTRETFSQFEHVTLRIIPGKEVRIEVALQGKSADVAPTLEAKMKRVLEILDRLLPTLVPDEGKRGVMAALLKSFRVGRDEERVTLAGKLPEAEWRKLLAPRR
jgi:hypothetical protein